MRRLIALSSALAAGALVAACATVRPAMISGHEVVSLDACHPGYVEVFLSQDWALAAGGLINVFTDSKYSHTGFVLCDGTFLDASPFGVRIRKASPARRVLIKADAAKVLGWALVQQGRPYGWGTFLTYKIGGFGSALGGLGCSQFVAEAFARDGISFGSRPARVSPGMIARWLKEST